MKIRKIAVVFTYYNRKEKTINCINKLHASVEKMGNTVQLSYYACDDGSTDNTSDELKKIIPDLFICKGTGDLFWAKGMAKAMEYAEKDSADFYLMINDDVDFYDDVLKVMLESFESVNDEMCAIVGSTKDAISGEHTYGGQIWNGKGLRSSIVKVVPDRPCPECNQANWNCFLIPRKLYERIGKIDDYYAHSWADFDYSNRISKAGYSIFVANNYVGTCSRNKIEGTWRDTSLKLHQRLKLMNKKNGLPFLSYWHYCKKFYGWESILVFLKPYLSVVKTSVLHK